MRPTLRTLALAGAALAAAVAPWSAAQAEPGGSSGWEPTSSAPFHLAAGQVCAFELQADVLYDHEMTRVVESNADGSPRVQDFKGSLGYRFTNVATGESVQRDASGTLRLTFHEDGGIDFAFGGNGLAVLSPRSAIDAPGVFITSGNVDLVRHPDGKAEFTQIDGTLENVCETLG